MGKIRYPKTSHGITSLDAFQGIERNWQFSLGVLEKLNRDLGKKMASAPVSVVVAGSFGRLEANNGSDLDFMIISENAIEPNAEKDIIGKIVEVCSSLGLKAPNPEGVFSTSIVIDRMLQTIGSREDNLVSLAQRMLLLMEARPIHNESIYRNAVDQVLRRYLELVIPNPAKEALFLLNDVIRYFRSICVNYQFNFWREEEKWVIRNLKLRHSRVIMYAGLLFVLMNASKDRQDKFAYISSKIDLTPLERIVHVYNDNNDPNLSRVLGRYDVFLRKISDQQVRDGLQVDYEGRYLNPYYADLRVNSEALQSELTRFVFARKGCWSDLIYEYLVF